MTIFESKCLCLGKKLAIKLLNGWMVFYGGWGLRAPFLGESIALEGIPCSLSNLPKKSRNRPDSPTQPPLSGYAWILRTSGPTTPPLLWVFPLKPPGAASRNPYRRESKPLGTTFYTYMGFEKRKEKLWTIPLNFNFFPLFPPPYLFLPPLSRCVTHFVFSSHCIGASDTRPFSPKCSKKTFPSLIIWVTLIHDRVQHVKCTWSSSSILYNVFQIRSLKMCVTNA